MHRKQVPATACLIELYSTGKRIHEFCEAGNPVSGRTTSIPLSAGLSLDFYDFRSTFVRFLFSSNFFPQWIDTSLKAVAIKITSASSPPLPPPPPPPISSYKVLLSTLAMAFFCFRCKWFLGEEGAFSDTKVIFLCNKNGLFSHDVSVLQISNNLALMLLLPP